MIGALFVANSVSVSVSTCPKKESDKTKLPQMFTRRYSIAFLPKWPLPRLMVEEEIIVKAVFDGGGSCSCGNRLVGAVLDK